MENDKWHKLDNSAKIYPLLVKKNHQNLFRLTAEMKEPVDAELLKRALDLTIDRYPYFNVSLKKGFFWYYLDRLYGKPDLTEDSDVIIRYISTVTSFGYNFRVSYYDKRIAIDFFHALCDGSGGVEFLKTLVYEYLLLCGKEFDSEEKVLLADSPVLKEETDDAFLRYAEKIRIKDIKDLDSMKGEKAFTLDGYAFEYGGLGIIQGDIPTDKLLALARVNNATITEYLSAVYIYSIYKTKRLKPIGNRPVVLFLPINLRKFFPSKTLLNFSMFSRVTVDINGEQSFEEILERTKIAVKKNLNKESVQNMINTTVKGESIFIFRILPLFIKQFIFWLAQPFFGKSKKTITFSNMGVIQLPQGMSEYVERFTAVNGTGKSAPASVTMCTALNTTTINFSRRITDTEVEKCFFRYLTENGLTLTVCSNYWEADNAVL